MAKVTLFTAALCLIACSANAEGISSTTLDDMGLSGIEIMSDSDALAVRGLGYTPKMPKMDKKGNKPWVAVGGASLAYLKDHHGGAGSVNFYLAEGKYNAQGENFSTASKVTEKIDTHSANGNVSVQSWKTIKTISAGGFSGASAF
ncbi:MAG: hypothetical protein WBF93_17510 [Pirellulales bacterium]